MCKQHLRIVYMRDSKLRLFFIVGYLADENGGKALTPKLHEMSDE